MTSKLPPKNPKVNCIAIYASVTLCSFLFSSQPYPSGEPFPSYVAHSCPDCKIIHNFRLRNTFVVSTPSQLKTFSSYAKNIGIVEQDVIISK